MNCTVCGAEVTEDHTFCGACGAPRAPATPPEAARPPQATTQAPITPAPPTPGPGWLPDPTGRFQYRYWDGANWSASVSRQGSTESDPITSPQPPSMQTSPALASPPRPSAPVAPWSTAVKIVVFVGAGALVLGSLLPWVKASAGAFTVTKNGIEGDGVLTLILAGLAALLFGVIKPRNVAAMVTLILGVLAGAIAAYDIADISQKAHDLSTTSVDVSATVGVGLILAALACVAIVVGAIMGISEAGRTQPHT
jgi:Protein of unknown function (DUF2510)